MKKNLQIFILLLMTQFVIAQNFGIQLDGQNGNVTLCDSDNFDIGEGFTLEAWIFANEWKAEAWQGSIINKDQQGPDAGFAFRAGKNGTLSLVMSVEQTWFEVQTDPIMNVNQWYHVAAVVNAGTLSLFINGNLINSGTFSGAPTHSSQSITLGASPGFPGRVWNGVLDEIRIWNIARTPDEIANNQMTTFTGAENGLVAYLPMNEGDATTTANLADAGCAGNLTGLGNDAWQDGFSVPATDVGILRIDAPDVLSLYERPVKVRVTLQNYGSEAVSTIPVELDINGLPALSDTFTGTIEPGETASFTFSTPLNLKSNNTNLLSASTAHPDDANGLNNGTSYRYRKPDIEDNSKILTILNEEQHNFGSAGQTKFTTVNMPKHVEDYDQLLLHFSVECPNTGCDPWDQPANFSIIKDGKEHEIARFITPYAIECGDWTVDVTDFKTILAGNVIFKSYVQVWGASGWLVNADLEFVKAAERAYSQVTPLWETQYLVYGDPGIDDDLPPQTNTIAPNTATAHLRMTISGHGQGNTNNAAEFSNQTHSVVINGNIAGTHNLWKADCGQNGCANQAGTWTLSRAGWCPGQQVTPFIFNLTNEMTPGAALALDYELQDYTNLLNTGYNDMGHTEPHYRIAGFLIEESDSHFDTQNNLRALNIAVETNNDPANPVFEAILFEVENTGTTDMTNAMASYYVNGDFVVSEVIAATIAAGETYVHEFTTIDGFTAGDDNEIIALVTAAMDENISDDGIDLTVKDDLTNIDEIDPIAINVFPNPTNAAFNVSLSHHLLNGNMEIFDVSGKLLMQQTIRDLNTLVHMEKAGVFFLKLSTENGRTITHKLIVQ